MARFVLSRSTKSETASKRLSSARVHDLIEAQGIGIVERMDGGILIDCTAAQAKALGDRLRGWVLAPEMEYDYPRRNPALQNPQKLFR